MIEPNRLSLPGEPQARARVEAVFAAIDRQTPAMLHATAIAPRDLDERARRIERLEGLVATGGREALLRDARAMTRETLGQRLATVLAAGADRGVTMLSGGRARDQVELVAAIDDAVAVAVAEDLLDPEDARWLSEPGRTVLGLSPVGDARGVVDDARPPAWEPTPEDWAAAAEAARDA